MRFAAARTARMNPNPTHHPSVSDRGWIRAGLLSLFLLAWISGLPAWAATPLNGPLRFATDEDFAPYSFEHNGQPAGVAVEMAQQLARSIERPIDVTLQPWDQAQQALLNGEADFIGPMSVTPARRDLYDFTDTFFTFEYVFLVRKDARGIASLGDLRGRKVGVTAG